VKVPGPLQRKRRASALSRVLLWTFLLGVFAAFAALAVLPLAALPLAALASHL